jgi:hypothetical protein
MPYPWVCVMPNVPDALQRLQIARTLEPDDAYYKRRIDACDFALEGFAVSPARLHGVGKAVKNGTVGIKIESTGPYFAAAYSSGPDRHFTLGKLELQPGDSWRATIVHESVHCAFDLAKEHPANELDEAAAYLAESVFWHAGGLRVSHPGADAGAAIFNAANEAVERLKLHEKRGQRLRRAQVDALIAAIKAHPGYGGAPSP